LGCHVATSCVGQVALGSPHCFGRGRFSYHDKHLIASRSCDEHIPDWNSNPSRTRRYILTHLRRSLCSVLSLITSPACIHLNQDVIICAPSLCSISILLQSLSSLFLGRVCVPYAINKTLMYSVMKERWKFIPPHAVKIDVLHLRQMTIHGHLPKAC
jgi:hypothetical protein